MGARRRVVFCSRRIVKLCGGSNKRKVFGQAFSKRLAKSKGSAFGRPSQRAKSFFRRALRKGLNLQNDPVDRFAKRGNPAREGSPLLANFTNYLSFHRAGENGLFRLSFISPTGVAKPYKRFQQVRLPAGRHFCAGKSAQNRLGDTPRPHAPERPLGTAAPFRSVG